MFGRKRGAARAVLTYSEPQRPHGAQIGGTAGWAPGYGTPHASQQTGRYAGGLLNQYPASPSGVQLHGGREWGWACWYYPAVSVIPNGSVQQTTHPNNISGGQRSGSIFGGPIGPVTARLFRAKVADAQVRQSGLSASDWAQGLTS